MIKIFWDNATFDKTIEEEKLKEEQRIRQEDRERKCQQQEAERILRELDERRKRIAAVASHHEEICLQQLNAENVMFLVMQYFWSLLVLR